MKELLMAQRTTIIFTTSRKYAKEVQLQSIIQIRDNLSEDLINELKNIETKINDVMLNLDLDKRLDLTKNIVQDVFKSSTASKKGN